MGLDMLFCCYIDFSPDSVMRIEAMTDGDKLLSASSKKWRMNTREWLAIQEEQELARSFSSLLL